MMEFKRGSVLSTVEEVDSTLSTPIPERQLGKTNDAYTPLSIQGMVVAGPVPIRVSDDVRHPGSSSMTEQGNNESVSDGSSGEWGVRHTLTLLSCLATAIQYSMRVNLSIAIVDMVIGDSNSTYDNYDDTCPLPDAGDNHTALAGNFEWDEQTQGLVLGAFYWGYATTQIVGGWVSQRVGGRLVMGLSVLVSSFITLLHPLCAYASDKLFIFIRFLEGVAQGVTFPALSLLLATWAPRQEKTTLVTIAFSGMQVGTVLGTVISGWLCDFDFLEGWPLAFLVFGVAGLVWCVPWFLLVRDTPKLNPWISQAELQYIQGHQDSLVTSKVKVIPWKAIMKSRPMWAAIMTYVAEGFSYYALLSEMPSYLHNIQHLDTTQNSFASSLPYVLMIIFSVMWGALMEVLTKKRVLSVLWVRRISSALGLYSMSAALFIMCFVRCNTTLSIVILCTSLAFNGASYSGAALIEQDIAPNLVSTLVGFNNTIGAIAGFIAPVIIGAILKDNDQTCRLTLQVHMQDHHAGIHLQGINMRITQASHAGIKNAGSNMQVPCGTP
nr:sialin-like [Cherax quadricarinatus]